MVMTRFGLSLVFLCLGLLPSVAANQAMGAEEQPLSGHIGSATSNEEPIALKKLTTPLCMVCETPLVPDLKSIEPKFHFVVAKSYTYQGQLLPAGTRLEGKVIRLTRSRRLDRPGYLDWQVNQVIYPDGETATLASSEDLQPRLHHPKGITQGHAVKSATPFLMVSSADYIPLTLATNMPSLAVAGISMGARMLYGATHETLIKKEGRDRPLYRKIGYGMLRGTGLPAIYTLTKATPAFRCRTGDALMVEFRPETVDQLFQAQNQTTVDAQEQQLHLLE
jgi:hypothetical protein